MPTPVRTKVLEALEQALSTIPELAYVRRFQPTPVDLTTIPTPACFVYDSLPDRLEKNNRFMRVESDTAIVVFLPIQQSDLSNNYEDFNLAADVIQGRIHNALHSQLPDPEGLIGKVEDSTVEREINNDIWGVLTYTVTITWVHKFGDAFSTGR